MICVQLVLCFILTVFTSKEVETAIDQGNATVSLMSDSRIDAITHNIQDWGNTTVSLKNDSRIDDAMHNIQGTCMEDNPYQTVKQLKEDTSAILDDFGVYREIVEMNKKLRTEIKWIIDESKGPKEVNRIIDLLMKDVREKCPQPKYRDCSDIKKYRKPSGVYSILTGKVHHANGVKAYCDMTTDGGGWTVIQRRFDGSVSFDRGWADYERGFGNVEGEYWLGNKLLHQLTSGAKCQLRIDLWDANDVHKYAEYTTFAVGDSESKYKLIIDGYSGNAGDRMVHNNGMKFSTIDQDNDLWYNNCAVDDKKGAWWSNQCTQSALNRKYTDKLYWSPSTFVRSVIMIRRH